MGAFCIILSMYGGGFSTVPAYLADLFGTQMVGAIHGRVLTAWAAAGIFGPVLISYLREYQLAIGVPRAQVYDITMYILAGHAGDRPAVQPGDPAGQSQALHDRRRTGAGKSAGARARDRHRDPWRILLRLQDAEVGHPVRLGLRGHPLAWGIWVTLQQAVVLFK